MSTVLANTITAVGGGGSTVKVNNDSTLISEGGAVTDHNLVQGVAKGFSRFDGDGTFEDSFNMSGITDHGTGDYQPAFTNSMSNAEYAASFLFGGTSGQAMIRVGGRDVATGNIGLVGTNGDQSSAQDVTISGHTMHGDLA